MNKFTNSQQQEDTSLQVFRKYMTIAQENVSHSKQHHTSFIG